jgi:anti-anti-sigma factor
MSATDVAPFSRSVPGLELSMTAEGSTTVIAVRGELDASSVPTLMDVLIGVIADRDGDVAVDLGHADFIDSAAARALGRAGQFLVNRGRRLAVRSPSRIAVRVLTIHDLFHLVAPASSSPGELVSP